MNHRLVPDKNFEIFKVNISPITLSTLHAFIEKSIHEQEKVLILNVNVHCLNLTFNRPRLRDFLNRAEIVFVDGAGVILGGRLLGYRIPQRITYADWIWKLSDYAVSRDFSFFFLGAKPGIANKAAKALKERYPHLHIAGVHHGYFDKSPASVENTFVVDKINAVKPNILIVGFGMPMQERWLMNNWQYIDANVAMTGGAVFDYVSGELQRAPRWMTENGLEWMGRLIIEPKRLWKRYLLGNPLFLWRIIKQRFGLLDIND